MSGAINTGGPTFPHDERAVWGERSGMTLRDYFAAKALQGFLATPATVSDLGYKMKNGLSLMENWANFAYQQADAMLAARGAA